MLFVLTRLYPRTTSKNSCPFFPVMYLMYKIYYKHISLVIIKFKDIIVRAVPIVVDFGGT